MKFELDSFNRNVSDEDLLRDLVAVYTKLSALGEKLTARAYKKHGGKYSAQTIHVRFGSWNDGVRRAGIKTCQEKNISIEDLFDNLKLVWISKGKQPVSRDMNSLPSRYRTMTYIDRFGSWRKALEEFVTTVEKEQFNLHNIEIEVKKSKGTKRTKRDPSLALRFLVLKRDRFCCVACGQSPSNAPGLELEIDHKLAWSKGGETIEENLQTLCFNCNRGKGAIA
ncbi:MAG: HNH endonuclease [Planctomycetota bacterium]|nr:HNH endonuclease [Planctomycetota bacterium]